MTTVTKTIKVYPSGWVEADSKWNTLYSYSLPNYISNAFEAAKSSDTTRAKIYLVYGSNSETYAYFTFDLSEIPEDAVITSINCKAKAHGKMSSKSTTTAQTIQLYTGTTPKGTATTLPSNNETTILTLDCGTWTRAELDDCRIKLYAKRGTVNTSTDDSIGLFGATLTVEYEVEASITGHVNIDGVKKEISTIYPNIDGTWKDFVKAHENIGGIWKE